LSFDISTDIYELLLHLVHIKYIYNELINRCYIVDLKLKVIKYKFSQYTDISGIKIRINGYSYNIY